MGMCYVKATLSPRLMQEQVALDTPSSSIYSFRNCLYSSTISNMIFP